MGSRIVVAPKGARFQVASLRYNSPYSAAILDASGPLLTQSSTQNGQPSIKNTRGLQFLTLPHPRTSQPSIFLPYQLTNQELPSETKVEILEVQAIHPSAPRSWFMGNDTVLEDGRILLFTPIDPAFLLLPILLLANPEGNAGNFREADDIFGTAAEKFSEQMQTQTPETNVQSSLHSQDILQLAFLTCVGAALSRLCEIKDLGDQTVVYQFSLPKTVQMLRTKAARLSVPDVAARTLSLSRSLSKDGLGPDEAIDEDLREAGRLKLACDLLSQYLPPPVYEALLASYDFSSLNAHVKAIRAENTTIEAPEQTKASAKSNGSKKRKAEVQITRGAQKLQKADTSKNKKLTSFFTKKPAVDKA